MLVPQGGIRNDHYVRVLDTIVGAVAELGKLTQIPTPYIDAIYASVKLLEATKERA